jgi:hypothetical protein
MTTSTTAPAGDLILQATGQVKILRLALTHLSDSGSIDSLLSNIATKLKTS